MTHSHHPRLGFWEWIGRKAWVGNLLTIVFRSCLRCYMSQSQAPVVPLTANHMPLMVYYITLMGLSCASHGPIMCHLGASQETSHSWLMCLLTSSLIISCDSHRLLMDFSHLFFQLSKFAQETRLWDGLNIDFIENAFPFGYDHLLLRAYELFILFALTSAVSYCVHCRNFHF